MSEGDAQTPSSQPDGDTSRPEEAARQSVFDASGVAHVTASVPRSSEAELLAERLQFPQTDDHAQELFLRWEHRDPFPEIPPALLNSADIADYAAVTGLIYPFYPAALKSASYAVRFLGEILFWDDDGNRIEQTVNEGDEFRLRRNSIAFVTLEPIFRLPDYIAGRFNLKIPNVYKGLLLGTGPLVDPGWTGILSIPLHNLTTQDYTFFGGEELIWMEFTKLSPNRSWTADSDENAPERRGLHVPFPPARRGGNVYTRVALASPNSPVTSSLAAVTNQVKKAASDANDAREAAGRITRLFTIGGGIALVVALITILALAVQVWTLRKDLDDLKQQPTTTTTPATTESKTTP